MKVNNEKLYKDVIVAWNSHKPEKILSFYTDDVLYEDVAIGKTLHSRKELAEFIKLTFTDIPDFHIEVISYFISGNWAAGESILSGTLTHSSIPSIPANGKSFLVKVASIMELSDGKIRRETDYYNAMTMFQQLGDIPK